MTRLLKIIGGVFAILLAPTAAWSIYVYNIFLKGPHKSHVAAYYTLAHQGQFSELNDQVT